MAEYSRNLANRGNSVNKAGEAMRPSKAVIDDFNSKFNTVRMPADATKLGIAKNTVKGLPDAAKKIGKTIVGKAKELKGKYDKAFEKGEKGRSGVMKVKKMMGTGYRP